MEKTEKETKVDGAICNDEKCPTHGGLKTRGRVFEGRITKKFPKRVVIEFERMIYSKKYERYFRSGTKIHAHLPDCIADKILGKHLIDKDKKVLYELAKSESIWDRRIAIISTFEFIKNGKFEDTLKISKILLKDEHDLIHKAVGWMLREIGKRDLETLEKFLKRHYKKMPRTMLRYAIEKFPEIKRKKYLAGII